MLVNRLTVTGVAQVDRIAVVDQCGVGSRMAKVLKYVTDRGTSVCRDRELINRRHGISALVPFMLCARRGVKENQIGQGQFYLTWRKEMISGT